MIQLSAVVEPLKMGVGRLRVMPRNSSTCCRKRRSFAEDVGVDLCLPSRLRGNLHPMRAEGDGGAAEEDGMATVVSRVAVLGGVFVDLENRGVRVVVEVMPLTWYRYDKTARPVS